LPIILLHYVIGHSALHDHTSGTFFKLLLKVVTDLVLAMSVHHWASGAKYGRVSGKLHSVISCVLQCKSRQYWSDLLAFLTPLSMLHRSTSIAPWQLVSARLISRLQHSTNFVALNATVGPLLTFIVLFCLDLPIYAMLCLISMLTPISLHGGCYLTT